MVAKKINIKIVADTNVLISALLWKKNLESFSELINSREITLCFSPKTAEELYRVTNYPHILKKAYENNFNHISVIDIIIENSLLLTINNWVNKIKIVYLRQMRRHGGEKIRSCIGYTARIFSPNGKHVA